MVKPKQKKMKLKSVIGIIFIIGILFLHFYLPRIITDIRNPIFSIFSNYHSDKSPKFQDNDSIKGKHFDYQSFDGLKLSAHLTYSNLTTTKGTIILVHGIRSNKEHFIGISKTLSNKGYNAVAIDLRAHGQSEGTHCTFGVNEKEDISLLINVLEKQGGITKNIGIWGQSLGGAIALQSLASDKRIKFGIIESTFSDLHSITNDYFKNKLVKED